MSDIEVALEIGSQGDIPSVRVFDAEPIELRAFLDQLSGKTCRDGSLHVRKWIREEIRDAGLRSEYKPRPGPPTSEEFTAGVNLLQSTAHTSRRLSIRAITAAASLALDTDLRTRWELAGSNERQILNLPSNEDVVQYFLDLLLNATKSTVSTPPYGLNGGLVCSLY